MRNTITGFVLVALALLASPLAAQGCGGVYEVQRGENLTTIAERYYGDAGKWSVIHSENLAVIGQDPNALAAGMRLRLSCIDGRPTALDGVADSSVIASFSATGAQPGEAAPHGRITLMAAPDLAPFTGRDLPNGGLMVDVVNAAMRQAAPVDGYAILWVEGRASHLDPLLSNALLDMGFPWAKPDCDSTPEAYLCTEFLFSDPAFEMLLSLFTSKESPLAYEDERDMHGKTLCRPAGLGTQQLDRPDRRWLKEDHVVLKQPVAVADCFGMLSAGEVDAVVINEFTGRAAIRELELAEKVQIAPRPLAIEGLHVLVHKSHPQAEAMLDTINEGLRGIREDGTFQQIIDAHLSRVWAEF